MYFKYHKDAKEYAEKNYEKYSIWFDSDEKMYYILPRQEGKGERVKEYTVTCWASQEIIVEAESKEDAEEIAVNECTFPYIDYCTVDEK